VTGDEIDALVHAAGADGVMLARAAMEVEETMQQWKQKPHIQQILEPVVEPADPYTNKDEFFARCGGARRRRRRDGAVTDDPPPPLPILLRSFLSGDVTQRGLWADGNPRKLAERAEKVFAQEVAAKEEGWEEALKVRGLLASLSVSPQMR
jgi:tRNA-dihydrouridine synthase